MVDLRIGPYTIGSEMKLLRCGAAGHEEAGLLPKWGTICDLCCVDMFATSAPAELASGVLERLKHLNPALLIDGIFDEFRID